MRKRWDWNKTLSVYVSIYLTMELSTSPCVISQIIWGRWGKGWAKYNHFRPTLTYTFTSDVFWKLTKTREMPLLDTCYFGVAVLHIVLPWYLCMSSFYCNSVWCVFSPWHSLYPWDPTGDFDNLQGDNPTWPDKSINFWEIDDNADDTDAIV